MTKMLKQFIAIASCDSVMKCKQNCQKVLPLNHELF